MAHMRPNAKLVGRVVGAVALAACLVLVGTAISTANAQTATSRQEFENCPRHAVEQVARNPWSRAQRMLAPRGVRVINLCRYASGRTGAESLKLAGNDLVSHRRTIRQLIHMLDALKTYHGPPIHCGNDRGDDVFATLYYRRHEVRIVVPLSGCRGVTNGDLVRVAFDFEGKNPAGPRLLRQLRRLTYRVHFAV